MFLFFISQDSHALHLRNNRRVLLGRNWFFPVCLPGLSVCFQVFQKSLPSYLFLSWYFFVEDKYFLLIYKNIISKNIYLSNILFRYFWPIVSYHYFFLLRIMMHASCVQSISFFSQNEIASLLSLHGCIRTWGIFNVATSFNIISVTFGGTTKITTSIFSPYLVSVGKTFCHRISCSLGLMGMTWYPFSRRSRNTLCPYLFSSLDAQTTA